MLYSAPMQVADALLKSQQFDLALDLVHNVFNPYADGVDIKRVWRWQPFRNTEAIRVLEGLLDNANAAQAQVTIDSWHKHPFQPWMVARSRTVAYMKCEFGV